MKKIFLLLVLSFSTLLASENAVVQGLDPEGDGFLSLRVNPKSTEIGKLYNDDELEILDKSGKYYKVKDLKSSKIGWAHSNWIKRISNVVEFYRKACDKKDGESCYLLALKYDRGKGVEQNETKAIELLDKACHTYSPRACLRLAIMYDMGVGVKKDEIQAKKFFNKVYYGPDYVEETK